MDLERLLKLMEILNSSGRFEALNRIISDSEYREQLYRENKLYLAADSCPPYSM